MSWCLKKVIWIEKNCIKNKLNIISTLIVPYLMDLLFHGSYTRLLCTLITSLYPIPSPSTGWTNWSINDRRNSNLTWRQLLPCHKINYILHSFLTDIVNFIKVSLSYNFSIKEKQFCYLYKDFLCTVSQ